MRKNFMTQSRHSSLAETIESTSAEEAFLPISEDAYRVKVYFPKLFDHEKITQMIQHQTTQENKYAYNQFIWPKLFIGCL